MSCEICCESCDNKNHFTRHGTTKREWPRRCWETAWLAPFGSGRLVPHFPTGNSVRFRISVPRPLGFGSIKPSPFPPPPASGTIFFKVGSCTSFSDHSPTACCVLRLASVSFWDSQGGGVGRPLCLKLCFYLCNISE